MAVGQTLHAKPLLKPFDIALTESGWIQSDPVTARTSEQWLFACGDMATGPSSVVAAIGAGERAAVGIDQLLTGERHAFWRNYEEVKADYDPDSDPVPYPRERIKTIDVERRRSNFDEVEMPWNESTATRQAKRCLRCDYGKCIEQVQ